MTRRLWLVGGGGIVAVAAILLAPAGLRRMAAFEVRRVEVRGVHYLEPDALVRIMALREGANLFDPVEPLEQRLIRVRGVASARIARRLPGTLEVTIDERVPVALAASDGRLALVDRRGVVLPYDPSRGMPDLPLAPADTAVLGVMERVRESDPNLFGTIVRGMRERGTVILESERGRLLFRVGATPAEIQQTAVVIQEAARRGMRGSEFDARFDGRVIVRGARRT